MVKFENIKSRFKAYILTERPWYNRYFVAIFLLVTSLILVDLYEDLEGARIYSLVLAASVVAAIHGGIGPAIFLSVAGAVLLDYFFIGPPHAVFDSLDSYIRVFLYAFSATTVSFLVGLLRESLFEAEHFKKIAQSANTAKDNLIALVSHDLKNPIGVILGFTEITKAKIEDQETLQHLNIIEKNCSVSLDLISDLQEFASLEHPGLKLKFSKLDINKLIEEITQSQSAKAAKKGIKIMGASCNEPKFIHGDEKLIRRALLNLIENAIKYSPLNSQVKIALEEGQDRSLTFLIVDQGEGIPASEQQKIFLPFYRTSANPTGGETSTGLGLATVAAIAKAHGAEVHVNSEEGQGSTFTLKFPYRE